MIHELSFFTDRVGYNVYRNSPNPAKTHAVFIASITHANELYTAQTKHNETFTKCAVMEITPATTFLLVDGRKIKGDFGQLLRHIEREYMTLSNSYDLSDFYQKLYNKIIANRA